MNVLFVSVDTTRADYIGCYGHPAVKTPNIDRLAAEGTRFAQCISSCPITLPSHSTMMTGSYQFVHGARENGTFVLSDENETLAELFKRAGYATHAEVATAVLDRRYGLGQGFDSYGDVQRDEGLAPRKKIDRQPGEPKAVTSGEGGEEGEPAAPELPKPWSLLDRKADKITQRGIELLKQCKDEPFFIFLHYYDPHEAHEAPERFSKLYADGYLAEIAYFDEQFGKLMDVLRELGLAEKTLVILTSDHGEGKGQHGEMTHSHFIYDTTVHVPLILWSPGQVPAGQTVGSQVRLIDLASTVVDFARLEPTAQMQGTSLLPLLADPSLDLHLPCYADTLSPKLMFDYSALRSLRQDGWKYILSPDPELYHVAEDPMEVFNVSGAETDRAADMRQQLRGLIADSPPPPGSRAAITTIDADEIRKLAALGYVAAQGDNTFLVGDSELDQFEPTGAAPRDRKEVLELMNVALGSLLSGDFAEAEKRYRRLLELEPNNAKATKELADSIAGQERLDDAEAMYREALKLFSADPLTHMSLGKLLAIRGDYEGSVQHYRIGLELDPTSYLARLHLALVLWELGRTDEAMREYEAAAETRPDLSIVFLQWGRALSALRRYDAAEAKMRRAVALRPDSVQIRLNLAYLLGEVRRWQDAVEQLLAVVEKEPDNLQALEMLASDSTKLGDRAAAGKYFQRVHAVAGDTARGFFNLGLGLALEDKLDEALVQYRKAVALRPNYVRALLELAQLLERVGQIEDAIQACDQLVALEPRRSIIYTIAANLMDRQGQPMRAVEALRQGRKVLPDDSDIANDLAWRLATSPQADLRSGQEAVELAELADRLTGGREVSVIDTLAAAYAEAGRFEAAVAAADRMLALTEELKLDDAQRERYKSRRDLYKKGKPYRDQ